MVFTKSSEATYDVQAIVYTKAMALRKLCELCFENSVTLCVAGDYHNDLAMMREADFAFCPENAVDEIKAISYATLCHHNEGLMADVVATIEQMIDRGEL